MKCSLAAESGVHVTVASVAIGSKTLAEREAEEQVLPIGPSRGLLVHGCLHTCSELLYDT